MIKTAESDYFLDEQKLKAFGFQKQGNQYVYHQALSDASFEFRAVVRAGQIQAGVFDVETNEEYVLLKMPDVNGAFIGRLRHAYESILNHILAQCGEKRVFQNPQTRRLIAYIRETYGDALEVVWDKFPHNAICRRADNQKWYAAFLKIPAFKLGIDSDEVIEILNVRCAPNQLESYMDQRHYFPAYHMNKKHWITLYLNESLPFETLCYWIDESYRLAFKK